jgi:hypothetical protein
VDKELKELLERIAEGLETINITLEEQLTHIDITLTSLFESINDGTSNGPLGNDNAVGG